MSSTLDRDLICLRPVEGDEIVFTAVLKESGKTITEFTTGDGRGTVLGDTYVYSNRKNEPIKLVHPPSTVCIAHDEENDPICFWMNDIGCILYQLESIVKYDEKGSIDELTRENVSWNDINSFMDYRSKPIQAKAIALKGLYMELIVLYDYKFNENRHGVFTFLIFTFKHQIPGPGIVPYNTI